MGRGILEVELVDAKGLADTDFLGMCHIHIYISISQFSDSLNMLILCFRHFISVEEDHACTTYHNLECELLSSDESFLPLI